MRSADTAAPATRTTTVERGQDLDVSLVTDSDIDKAEVNCASVIAALAVGGAAGNCGYGVAFR
jgi:hypothetical protein